MIFRWNICPGPTVMWGIAWQHDAKKLSLYPLPWIGLIFEF